MRYADLFNTTREEIEAGRWNPYLGISIRNRYFTPEAILAFARWGAQHAREGFALLIVDILQRINNEVFERAHTGKAIEKAFRQADPVLEHCRAAVAALPADLARKVVIVEWADIVDETYAASRKLVFEHYESCPEFRDYMTRSVSQNLGGIVDRLREGDLGTLCQYILYEIPEFLRGFVYQGVHYNLCAYPGSIAFLTRELVRQDFFAPLLERMGSYGPMAHAEVYVQD